MCKDLNGCGMSYLVLARKFRPQTFSSIAGQAHITLALANAIIRNRVPHAFLFTGPRGVGKTTAARVLAKALNCTGREIPQGPSELSEVELRKLIEPCGVCANCQEIVRSASMSVWEIDGASNNSVDNVRELIESLRTLPPPGSRYKIYIIDEVHMLSVAAFNALLKSLEEPPPNTIFVFATTEPHKIPETVISRCQRHDFRRLSNEVIAQRLAEISQEEKLETDPEVFYFLARAAQGGMRDAQSMFDRLIAFSTEKIDLSTAQKIFGMVDRRFFLQTSEAVLASDAQKCFALLDEVFAQSLDVRLFAADFVRHWRNVLIITLAGEGKAASDTSLQRMLELSSDELQQLRSAIAGLSAFDAQRLFDIAERTAEQALRTSFPRYIIEAGLAKMSTLPSLSPLPELVERIEHYMTGKSSVTVERFKDRSVTASSKVEAVAPVPPQKKSSISAKSPGLGQNEDKTSVGTGYNEPKANPIGILDPREPIGEPVTEEKESWFNPSWQEFLLHVKSRGELFLEAMLRRVSPSTFVFGTLVVEAAPFDLQSLGEADMRKSLNSCLFSYSGSEKWNVRLIKHEEKPAANVLSKDPSESAKELPITSAAVPGSVSAMESQVRRKRRSEVEQEARSNPVVQAALSMFKDSRIERISILDEQGVVRNDKQPSVSSRVRNTG